MSTTSPQRAASTSPYRPVHPIPALPQTLAAQYSSTPYIPTPPLPSALSSPPVLSAGVLPSPAPVPPPPLVTTPLVETPEHVQVRNTYATIDRRQHDEMIHHRSRLDGSLQLQAEAAYREHSSRARLSAAQLQAELAAQRAKTWEEEKAAVESEARAQEEEHKRVCRELRAAEKRTQNESRRALQAHDKLVKTEFKRDRMAARVAQLEAATSVGKLVLDNASYNAKLTHEELRHAELQVGDLSGGVRNAKSKLQSASCVSETAYNEVVETQRRLREATNEVSVQGSEVATAAGRCRAAELHHSASLQHAHNVATYLRHVDPAIAPGWPAPPGSPIPPVHVSHARADLHDAQLTECAARMTMNESARDAEIASQKLLNAEQRLSMTNAHMRVADCRLHDASLEKARSSLEVKEKKAAYISARQRTAAIKSSQQLTNEERARAAAELARKRASLKRAKDKLAKVDSTRTNQVKEVARQSHAAETATRVLSVTKQREEQARRDTEMRLSDARVADMRCRASSAETHWAEQQCLQANRDFINASSLHVQSTDDAGRAARALAAVEQDNIALQRERANHEMSPLRFRPAADIYPAPVSTVALGTTA